MQDCFLDTQPADSVPLIVVAEDDFSHWLECQTPSLKRWVTRTGFQAKPGSLCLVSDGDGDLGSVIVGVAAADDIWACGGLPDKLPAGSYHLVADWDPAVLERVTVGWGLGAYRFSRYKKTEPVATRLVIDPACDVARVNYQVEAIGLVRDLINTPAEDMMPEQLADAVVVQGQAFSAPVEQIVDDELLAKNYPAIHRVGRASVHPPRLIDLRWGDESQPKLTLVGKGVCFDSGGLDLKSANNMRLMKKDMGGAAHAIGLAHMVMSARLPVRLRVLIAAVENAVSSAAFRPGDVLTSRKGLTIEVDNTDAEGRLVLCDALAEGGAEHPVLMIDFATLTGAARVALGAELPALFTHSDAVADGLLASAQSQRDPIWRLPLHQPYRELLNSKIADIANAANAPFGGAITAALFLQEFVPESVDWVHFDIMAWNRSDKPGRPEGGEAMGLRGVFEYLRQRFGG